MTSLILIYAVIAFVSLVFMVFLMLTSPWGWEDEQGFREVKNQKSKVKIK